MTTPTAEVLEPGSAPTPGASSKERQRSSDPPGSTTGWIIKIVLLGLADAIALIGLLIAFNEEAWGYFAVLAVTLIALNVVYLPRRYVPMKYLLPGVFFLLCFGVYPVLYTAYISTTNYGTGFVLSKDQAIDQIQSQSITQAEGATAFDVTPMAGRLGRFAGYGLFDPETSEAFLGTEDGLEPLEDDVETQVLSTTGRTFIVSAGDLTGVRPGQVDELAGYPSDPAAYLIPGQTEGSFIGISGGQAFESAPSMVYDADNGTMTDTETGVVYEPVEGQFTAPDGSTLTPGFTASVGFDNYKEVFTGSEFRGSFGRVLVWNLVFAFMSVLTCFAFGLLLALVFNDERLRGRKFYRSLIIIPYALPAFMTALVWRGLLNTTFGINRWLGTDIGWLESTGLAMFSLILVNMWLGYPYMFLGLHGCVAEHPVGPEGSGVRRRGDRVHDVPQGDVPVAADRGEPPAGGQLRLQLQQLHDRVPADRWPAARQRRDRGDDGHPADLGLPHRPRPRPEAAGHRGGPHRDDLHPRGRAGGRRVQGHQDVRGGALMSVGEVGMVREILDEPAPAKPARIPGKGRRWFIATGWRHIVAVLALLFALFPVWIVVIAAFSENGTLGGQTLWPESITTKQYDALVADYPYWRWFANSLVISVVAATGTVLLASTAAYAFSRLRFRGRRPGLFALLLIQMFPPALAFVAIFIMVDNIDEVYPILGSGSMLAIIVFYLGGALGANAWLIKGFFDTIPRDLDESAEMDGATHNQVFWKIIFPLSAPVLAIIFLLAFIAAQAEFLIASVILFGQDLESEQQTLATGLRGLLSGDRYDLRWGPFAMGALIGALPVILLFQFLQRYIVGGITAGAVKG